MNTTTPTPSQGQSIVRRTPGGLLLLAAGILSPALVAMFLDDQGSENWILPVQIGGMAVVGALVGVGVPGFLSGSGTRRALLGAAAGVAAAMLGVVVFFLLLSGIDGA